MGQQQRRYLIVVEDVNRPSMIRWEILGAFRYHSSPREMYFLDLQAFNVSWFRITLLLAAVYGSFAHLFFTIILDENMPRIQDVIPHYDLGVILGEEEYFMAMSDAAKELEQQYPKNGITRIVQFN